ncbi:MAG: hypothetical protein ACKVS7_03800 [Gemmatimonadaceae bacterium]
MRRSRDVPSVVESPLADWAGRNGWLILFAIILLELAFHGWAVWSARTRNTTAPSQVEAAETTGEL